MMIAELAVTAALLTDPLEAALEYHDTMGTVAEKSNTPPAPDQERVEDATAVARGNRSLPPLLALIRSHESGGNYQAYNPGGCEGYGCGGAYQLHARYASTWAQRAGFTGLPSNAATWPAATQDAVALDLFYSTTPAGSHWCRWTTYC
jgi:hypothetical protein